MSEKQHNVEERTLTSEVRNLYRFDSWSTSRLSSLSGLICKPNSLKSLYDVGLIPGLWRSSGGGNGNPLQHSCLGNPMDRGAWWATVHGVAKSRPWLSHWTTTRAMTQPLCKAEIYVFAVGKSQQWHHSPQEHSSRLDVMLNIFHLLNILFSWGICFPKGQIKYHRD